MHMYISIWWGFVALSSQSCFSFRCWWLLYWKPVTWWVSFFFFLFFSSSGENKPSLRYSNPSSKWPEERKTGREVRQGITKPNTPLLCHTGNPPLLLLAMCLPLRVFPQKNPSNPNYNTTQPVSRVLVYERRTHWRSCPVADSHSLPSTTKKHLLPQD